MNHESNYFLGKCSLHDPLCYYYFFNGMCWAERFFIRFFQIDYNGGSEVGICKLITVQAGGHSAPRPVDAGQVRTFLERHLYGRGKPLPDETVPVK